MRTSTKKSAIVPNLPHAKPMASEISHSNESCRYAEQDLKLDYLGGDLAPALPGGGTDCARRSRFLHWKSIFLCRRAGPIARKGEKPDHAVRRSQRSLFSVSGLRYGRTIGGGLAVTFQTADNLQSSSEGIPYCVLEQRRKSRFRIRRSGKKIEHCFRALGE